MYRKKASGFTNLWKALCKKRKEKKKKKEQKNPSD